MWQTPHSSEIRPPRSAGSANFYKRSRLVIMSTQALKKSLSFTRLSLATAALLGVLSTSVQAETLLSGYAGGTFGIAPSQRQCFGASVCGRAAVGGKLFGGWNVTPNVAAEINYFYFSSVNTAFDANQTAANGNDIASVREDARAMTLGMNWSVELFQTFTNNIRLGVARTQVNKEITSTTGAVSYVRTYSNGIAPYLGLGLSMQINRHLRFVNGYDFIIQGHDSHHLLSVGFQGEF